MTHTPDRPLNPPDPIKLRCCNCLKYEYDSEMLTLLDGDSERELCGPCYDEYLEEILARKKQDALDAIIKN